MKRTPFSSTWWGLRCWCHPYCGGRLRLSLLAYPGSRAFPIGRVHEVHYRACTGAGVYLYGFKLMEVKNFLLVSFIILLPVVLVILRRRLVLRWYT